MSTESIKCCIPLLKGQIRITLAHLRKRSSLLGFHHLPLHPLHCSGPRRLMLQTVSTRSPWPSGFGWASGGTVRSTESRRREVRVFFYCSIPLAGPQDGRGCIPLVKVTPLLGPLSYRHRSYCAPVTPSSSCSFRPRCAKSF